jgi:hypothetical protein
MSDATLQVLLGLRLKGFGGAEAIAEVIGLPADVVSAELTGFADKGWSLFREGRMTGWSLTAEGRAEGERRFADQLDGAGRRSEVQGGYERFLGLNHEMLAVCTDWQMKDETTLNDHTDAGYDAAVVARLADIHEKVSPVCHDLTAALDRFGGYHGRLANALAKVQAGENEWFTSVRIASYHTVWFELHENLLATLGIDRATEGSH